jgi:hypothetical protein
MTDLKNNLIQKIKSGEVDMKPRWHFILKSLLLVFGVITAALIVVYLLSFVLFVLRQSGVGFVPMFGFKGIGIFVMNSPWLLISSAGIMGIVLLFLIKKYSFSYQRPLVYTTIITIVFVLCGSFVIGQTDAHTRMQEYSRDRNVPVFGSLYRGIDDRRPDHIVFGIVDTINADGFVMQSDTESVITVVITEHTKTDRREAYEAGQRVLVVGDTVDNVIEAIGVRIAPSDFRPRQEFRSDNRPLKKS